MRPRVCVCVCPAAAFCGRVPVCVHWPVQLRGEPEHHWFFFFFCCCGHANTFVHTLTHSCTQRQPCATLSHTNTLLLASLAMFIWIFQRRRLARLSRLMNYGDGESVRARRTGSGRCSELTSVCGLLAVEPGVRLGLEGAHRQVLPAGGIHSGLPSDGCHGWLVSTLSSSIPQHSIEVRWTEYKVSLSELTLLFCCCSRLNWTVTQSSCSLLHKVSSSTFQCTFSKSYSLINIWGLISYFRDLSSSTWYFA